MPLEAALLGEFEMGSMLSLQNSTSGAGLMPFHFGGVQVRVVTDENGEALFVGRDVCDVLSYVNAADAITKHCRGVARRYPLQTAGGVQDVRVLAEPDVLRLIVNCTLPAAQAFERLVFEEILPTVRRTGAYAAPAPAPALPNFLDPVAAARAWADSEEQKQQLQIELAAAAPAVEFVERYVESTGLMTFRQVAKLLKVKEPEFRQFLHSQKIMYPLNGEWTAHAQHIEAGRFEMRAGTATNEHAYNTAKFTAKGVEWVAGELAKWQLKQREEGRHV
jgi:anti-repressor protein